MVLAACGSSPSGGTPTSGTPAQGSTPPVSAPATGGSPLATADGSGEVVVHSTEVPPLHPSVDDYGETTVVITTAQGTTHRLAVKVAATDAQRQHGLMEVEHLPDGTGMLFEMERERTSGFWMFQTLVPLSIAYVDADGRIADIVAMEPCRDPSGDECPAYPPRDGVVYVRTLEVPQGWFARHDITVGDVLETH